MVTDLSAHVPRTVPARFELLDDRFAGVDGDARMVMLFCAGRWLEGPVYVPAGRYVLFSDIPNDRVLRWDETTGAVGVFRQPAGYANGRTLDRAGRVVSCQHGHRRVARTEHDGSDTDLGVAPSGPTAQQPQRRRRAGRRDGLVHRSQLRHRQRLRGPSGAKRGRRMSRVPHRPIAATSRSSPMTSNGRTGSPSAATSSSSTSPTPAADTSGASTSIDDGSLSGGDVFADCDAGSFDGLRLDGRGRVWAAAHDGLHCFDPDGTLLGKLHVPEVVSNLAFGGPQRNHLFITATTTLYTLRLNCSGATYPAV